MSYDYNKSTALIIGMTDTDEKVTAAAGRVSTQEGTALSIWDKSQDKEKNTNLIGKVTASGHTSTVEHTYFQLAFQNYYADMGEFVKNWARFFQKMNEDGDNLAYIRLSEENDVIGFIQDDMLSSVTQVSMCLNLITKKSQRVIKSI